MSTTYLGLLRARPAYRRLWAAELVSLTGDWFSIVAVSVLSLEAPGGGVFALATALAAHLLPQTLAAPFGGWLADRLDKRKVLLGCAVLEGLLTLAMVPAAASRSILALQALLVVRSIVSSAREPATGAALPRLVGPGELRTANALGAFTWSLAFAVGMAAGGVATAVGPEIALAIDAGTFAVAALLLLGLQALPRAVDADRDAESGGGESAGASPLADVRRALALAWSPALRRSVFAFAPIAFATGAGWIALNLASQALPLAAGAATTLGLFQALRGIGTGVGPIVVRAKPERWSAAAVAAVLAGSLGMALAPALPFTLGLVLTSVAAFVWGAGGGAVWVLLTTEIQESSAEAVRGRMIAFGGVAFTLAMSTGALGAAWLVESGAAILPTCLGASVLSLAGWVALRQAPSPRTLLA